MGTTLMLPDIAKETPLDVAASPFVRETPLLEYLGAKLGQGWDWSSPGQAVQELGITARELAEYGDLRRFEGTGLHSVQGVGLGSREQPAAEDAPYLSEEDWKASEWHRPGMAYTPRMTPVRARAYAEAYDERRYRDLLIERSPGGLRSILGFAAGMAGGALDPVNYIPVFGPGARAFSVARLGPVLGRAAVGGAEAAVATAATDPLIVNRLQAQGETVGWGDVVRDIAMAGALGSGLGAVHGVLDRAFRKAVADVRTDNPVDVGQVPGVREAAARSERGVDLTREPLDLDDAPDWITGRTREAAQEPRAGGAPEQPRGAGALTLEEDLLERRADRFPDEDRAEWRTAVQEADLAQRKASALATAMDCILEATL